MEQDNEIPARNALHSDASGKNKIVKTYAEDMARVIEGDSGGLIKKIIHGEQEHEKEKINLSPESKRNRFFMFMSLLLIFLALAIFSFFISAKGPNTVEVEKQFTPIIFNDKSDFIEVAEFSKDKIIQTIFNIVDGTSVKEGGVEGIYLSYNKKIIGLRKFMELLGANLGNPNDGAILVNDNFLIGVVNGETKDFFILLKVRSVADTFNILRAWENKMFLDLHRFFGVEITAETKYLLTANFENGVVENKNARILYDSDNKIVMMYIFADDTSVIITNTENAADEIMLRLASSRVKK